VYLLGAPWYSETIAGVKALNNWAQKLLITVLLVTFKFTDRSQLAKLAKQPRSELGEDTKKEDKNNQRSDGDG
jgi:hypothetical protein